MIVAADAFRVNDHAGNHAEPAQLVSSFAHQQKQRPDSLLNRAADL
jgi:hypothetical protein